MALKNTVRFVLILRSNWLSWIGALLTTVAFLAIVCTYVLISVGVLTGPYVGLLAFLVLPAAFVLGILLVPLGLLIYRKELEERIQRITHKPLRVLRTVGVLTLVNIAVVSVAGYEGVHYMDSVEFCGTLCHEVMSPTYEAYQDSAHARVKCVSCHIGPGASWFVKSKLSGLRQVLAVTFDTWERPIPTPVHDLRPARETCEQCHWPDKFTGDRLVVRQHFEDDREVTPYTNVLVMKTGGKRPDGTHTGIHWHVHPGNEVVYVATDEKRTKIPWVKLTDETGAERVFTVEDVDPQKPPPGELRTMDCVDCHNQPSHTFQQPDEAIDEAIAAGLISRRLPYAKRVGLEALQKEWPRETAEQGITEYMLEFYANDGGLPDAARPLLSQAAETLARIYRRNVYPDAAVTWGTYTSFEGHRGCLRCHDGEHLDAEGDEISMDCETCHVILSQKEREPEILDQLGLDK